MFQVGAVFPRNSSCMTCTVIAGPAKIRQLSGTEDMIIRQIHARRSSFTLERRALG